MSLEEILATLDEDEAQEIRNAILDKEKDKARVERDLYLATNKEIKEAYPRAWRAYELDELDLGESTDINEVKKILKANEEKLARLGVPVSTNPPAPQPASQGGAEEDASDNNGPDEPDDSNPGDVFGEPVSGGSATGSTPLTLTQEFLESMKTDSETDRARMAEILVEMNKRGMKREIDNLVDVLNAPPIPQRDIV